MKLFFLHGDETLSYLLVVGLEMDSDRVHRYTRVLRLFFPHEAEIPRYLVRECAFHQQFALVVQTWSKKRK